MRKKGHFPIRGKEDPAAKRASEIIMAIVGIIILGIIIYLIATT